MLNRVHEGKQTRPVMRILILATALLLMLGLATPALAADSAVYLDFYAEDGYTPEAGSMGGKYVVVACTNYGNSIDYLAKADGAYGSSYQLTFSDSDWHTYTALPDNNYTFKIVAVDSDLDLNYIRNRWNYDPDGHIGTKYENSGASIGPYTLTFPSGKDTDGNYHIKFTKKSGYNVTVNFVDSEERDPVTPGSDGAPAITDKAYIKAELLSDGADGSTTVVGYAIVPISTSGSSNSVVLDSFKTQSGNMPYAQAMSSGYRVGGIRLFHTTDSNENPGNYNSLNDYNNALSQGKITEGDFDGYTFVKNLSPDEKTRIIVIRQTDPTKYQVKVDVGDKPLEIPADANVYAKVTVSFSSGAKGYSYIKLDDSQKDEEGNYLLNFSENQWYLERNGSLAPSEALSVSGHEQNMKVELYAAPKGATITSPNQLNDAISLGSFVQDHKVVSYPNVNRDETNNPNRTIETVDDPENGRYTQYTDIIRLAPDDSEFDGYSLEYILNDYNIVALCPNTTATPSHSDPPSTEDFAAGNTYDGDFLMENHCMGGVLVRGDVIHKSGTGVGDSELITKPSVVGGYVPESSGPFFNNRHNNPNGWNGYVGSMNTVAGDFYVNGVKSTENVSGQLRGYTGTNGGHTIARDDFVDWDRLQAMVINTSKELARRAAEKGDIVNYTSTTINVTAGSNIILNYPENTIVTINIIAQDASGNPITDPNKIPGTVISNLGSGTYTCPKLTLNGASLDTTEDGSGMSVVYNFPFAERVNVTTDITPEFGHVVAPAAFVDIQGGNYSGCMVGNKVRSVGEGHLYSYHGGDLLGFYGDLEMQKKVNDTAPTDKQKFKFNLEKLSTVLLKQEYHNDPKEFWTWLMKVENEGSKITFKDVPFTHEGKNYFMIYEDQNDPTPKANETRDTTKYLVEVMVVSKVIGDETILEMQPKNPETGESQLKYYKILDEEHLTNVNEIQEVLYDPITHQPTGELGAVFAYGSAINPAAVEEVGNLSWDPDAEKLTTDMTFINGVEEVKVQATLSGQKTLEGRTLAADQFSYTIKGTNDKTETVTTTTVKNRQAGDFSTTFTYKLTDFDELEFEEEAPHTITYTYTITEDIPADAVAQDDDSITYSDDIRADHTWVKDGIAYDGASYTVTVVVTDNQDGTMSAQVTGPNTALNFTNKYSAETDITLEALKNLNGKTLTAGQFSFSLTGSDISQTGKTNAADGKVTFGALKFALNPTQEQIDDGYIDVTEWFTEEGEIVSGDKTLTLTIAEENLNSLPEHVAAVEPTSREATVKVSYDVDTGVLTAALDPATQTFEFTNNWNAEAQVDVSVAKTLTGRTLKEKEFTFQLSGTGIAEAQTVQNGADGKASFSTVKFAVNPTDEQTAANGYIDATAWFTDENGKLKTGTKELTWTVEELDPLPEDVTVVGDQSKTLTVTLAYDAAAGTLTATPNPSNTEFAFENAFHATTEASVSAKKVLTGRTLGNGEFTFTLSGTGIETQTKTNNTAGAVAFEPLKFAVNPTEQERQNGYIDITDIIKTTNPYVLNLTVKESTDGLADKHITLVTPEGGVVAVTVTVTQAEDGSLSAAVSPDEAAAFVFTNAYHTDTDIELSATKVLEGLKLTEDQFTFTLKGEGIQTQEKKNDENGAVAFDKIHFAVNPTEEQTQAGYIDVTGWFTDEDGKIKNGNKTIELTIEEDTTGLADQDIAPVGSTQKTATVKVSYNAATGELTAALDPATQTFEFINEKNAEAQVEVSVAKTLTGRTMKENEFTFKLWGDEITDQTVKNGADGKASFSAVKFAVNPTDEQTAANGYIDATAWFTTDGKLKSGSKMLHWNVEEVDLPANVKAVGDQSKPLTVMLEYNADEGTLDATPNPENTEFTFTNAFHATTQASVSATKVLTGRTLGNGEFTFTLSGTGIETQTKTNNTAGAVAFEPLKFAVNPTEQERQNGYIDITDIIKTTNPYVLNLTVKESTDGLADKHITLVTPESGEVAVTVTVTQAEDGSLSASVAPTGDAAFTFTNAFHAETEVQLKAKKVLEGMTLTNGQFTFTLTGNGIEQSKQNGNNGTTNEAVFDAIHFVVNPTDDQTAANGYIDVTDLIKESGEYVFTFVLAEDTTNLPDHVSAKDPTSYEVEIKVTQDASTGALNAAITEPADAKFEFTNEYSTETQVTVKAKKKITGRNLNEGEFTFTLTGDGVSQEKTNGADGLVNFDAIKFAYNATQTQLSEGYIDVKDKLDANNQYKLTLTLAEVTTDLAAKGITPVGDTSKTVTVTVKLDPATGNLSAEASPALAALEFTNAFHDEVSVKLSGTKALKNRNLHAGEFTFTLKGTGVDQTKTNGPVDGRNEDVVFDAIHFVVNPKEGQTAANGYIDVTDLLDDTGKYELSLTMAEDTEQLPDDVTPVEPTSYDFKVIVTQDQVTGKLSATIDPQNAEFKFTNEYNAVASVSLEALKKLSGKTLNEGDFTFTLKGLDGKVSQTKQNGADGKVTFNDLYFSLTGPTIENPSIIGVADLLDEAGKYTLTLTMAEDTDSLPANIIPVGNTEKTVTIQVSYNRDTGVISAALDPADAEFTFLNANNAEAEVQVKGKKTLNGRTLEAGEFTFKLSGDQIKTETKTNAASADGGKVEFTPVKFVVNPKEDQTAAKGYINVTSLFMKNGVLSTGEATLDWKVTEDTEASNWPENVTPVGDTEKAVKVTLNYDAEAGTLTAKTDLDEAGFEFVNAYNAAAGVTVTATKKLDGRNLKAKDFTFTLTGDGVDQEKQNDANGKVTFETINFAVNPTEDQTAENGYIDVTNLLVNGKYTLTLTLEEALDKLPVDVKPEGDTSQTVTIQVTYDEEEGTLNAAIDPEDAVFEFTNKYNAAAEVTVKAKKQLTGKTLKAGDFTFTLKGTDPLANLSDSKTNGQDGLVTFDTLKFALNPTDEQADYIDVTDWFKNADGKIVSDSKQIKLTVAEVTEGLDEKGITPVGDTSKEIKLTVAYNASTGELTASIDPTSPVFTFRNKYTTDTGIIVTAQKTLNGREMVDGEFTFTLKGNGVNQQKNAGDGGAVEFDAIQFVLNPTEEMDAIDVTNLLEDGEYTLELTLAEVTTGLADKGITPVGDTSKTVKIKVTYDEDEGTLSAALDPANATFEFTNDYKAEGDVTFAGAKTIDNRDLMEGDVFRFTIKGDDGFEKTVACDIATGKIQYPTITYVLDKDHLDVLGDHTYTITEETVDMDGVTKDETTHEVTVTVSDNGNGTLKVTPSGSITGMNFVNHYETETEIELGAQKRLKNGTLSADQFTFTLTGKTGDTPMPENAKAGNAADGSVAFGPITYTLDDLDRDQDGGFKTTVYEYTITETVPDGVNARNILDGVRYDGNSFNVKVTLTYNRTKGELKANADKEANDLVFINEQLGKLQLEKTWEGEDIGGDIQNLLKFTVKGKNVNPDGEEKDELEITYADFTDGQYLIEDLPIGETYTVTEENAVNLSEEWHLVRKDSVTAGEATTKDGTVTVSLTNKYDTYTALKITKAVESTVQVKNRFDFEVELTEDGSVLTGEYPTVLTDASGKEKEGTLSFGDDGKAAFKLGDGETLTIQHLPQGVHYAVNEKETKGFLLTEMVDADGVLEKGPSEAKFVNTAETTKFQVTKQWVGGNAGIISLTLYRQEKGRMVPLSPQPGVTRDGDVYTFENLPKYDENGNLIVYAAKEKGVDGFMIHYANIGEHSGDSSYVYDGGTIINSLVTDIAVLKVWEGLADKQAKPEIKLVLYKDGKPTNKKPRLDKNGWYHFYNLEVDHEYYVVEEKNSAYTTEYKNKGSFAEYTDRAYNYGTIINHTIPKTGDETPLALWIGLAGVSAVGLAVLVILRKKRSKSK